ncbi:MAG: ABC transporter substrate-binding protein [Chitinispirillales bacterium]|jgi:ABC-type branched-subunit amino acid transport system substrate-binding protein|nr:ABC transporter substrate-binding protein [Chitinispirillales bacterium]
MKKILLFLFCSVFCSFGDSNDSAVKNARKALAAKDYVSVVGIYKSLRETVNADNQLFELLEPIYIEALTFQRNYDQISKLSASYIAKYPTSKQVVRVYYLWGVAQANLGNFLQSLIALDEGIKIGSRDKYTEKSIRNLIEDIAGKYISSEDRNKALQYDISAETVNILRSRLGVGVSVQEEKKAVSKGSGKFVDRTIGLLVPLTGEFAQLGEAAVNTVNMILDENEAVSGEKFVLKIYDTEGNAVKTALKTRELIKDKVSMVIGPIMSNTATVASAILSEYPNDCIMITPTATDDGIAMLGRNIFQINLTTRVLAEKIANYAVEDLKINEFTILAPLNEYGNMMTNYFTLRVKELGGNVEFTEYFSPTASDHRKQFYAMREHYANSKYGISVSDEKTRYFSDTTIVVGGIFLPVSTPENAVQLAAQIPFHKISGQILGASVWDNPKVIIDGKSTVQNVCFSTAHKVDNESEAFRKFVGNYKNKYGVEPNPLVVPLVADALSLMLKAYSQSGGSFDELLKNLSHISGYNGLSSEISFDSLDGVNTGAVVIKISGQKMIRVK